MSKRRWGSPTSFSISCCVMISKTISRLQLLTAQCFGHSKILLARFYKFWLPHNNNNNNNKFDSWSIYSIPLIYMQCSKICISHVYLPARVKMTQHIRVYLFDMYIPHIKPRSPLIYIFTKLLFEARVNIASGNSRGQLTITQFWFT